MISTYRILFEIKRYWENKRQTIHSHEKELEKRIGQYEKDIAALEQSRKEILNRAKHKQKRLSRRVIDV